MSNAAPLLQDPSLIWGVLSLLGPVDEEDENPFQITAMAQGTNLGNPVRAIEFIESVMTDMAFAVVTGTQPREVPIRLRVSANDGEGLAAAEAALTQQYRMERPPPLVWTPPAGLSAACVFDVVVADLAQDTADGWDIREKTSGDVFYVLTLSCLPWVRPVQSTVVPALPLPVDPDTEDRDVIDECTSLTGWTLETNGGSPTGPTLGASSIQATAFIDNANDHLRLVRTGAITVPDDYYLAVDVTSLIGLVPPGWQLGRWRARLDDVYVDPIAITQDGESGSTRLFFDNVGTIAELAILKDFDSGRGGGTSGTTALRVYNVATTDTLGSSSTTTNRQQSRLVTVTGSAPTQAQLRLFDATPDVLGTDMLVYTSRNTLWRPNLRRWIALSEAPTGDSGRVSGAWHTLASPTKILIPADQLTLGTYALMALMDVDAAGTLEWQARMTTLAGAATVGSGVVFSGEIDLDITTGYELLNLADLVLPVVEVEGVDYAVELTLTGTVNMKLDEGLLFSITDGVLTQLHDTEGVHGIELRSPELGAERPSVWAWQGDLGSPGAAVTWKTSSFSPHEFEPGQMLIYTMCTTSLVSQCELEFFPRFHTRVWGAETA